MKLCLFHKEGIDFNCEVEKSGKQQRDETMTKYVN